MALTVTSSVIRMPAALRHFPQSNRGLNDTVHHMVMTRKRICLRRGKVHQFAHLMVGGKMVNFTRTLHRSQVPKNTALTQQMTPGDHTCGDPIHRTALMVEWVQGSFGRSRCDGLCAYTLHTYMHAQVHTFLLTFLLTHTFRRVCTNTTLPAATKRHLKN